jgi:hypothetical protein
MKGCKVDIFEVQESIKKGDLKYFVLIIICIFFFLFHCALYSAFTRATNIFQIFTGERRCYTRQELALHRRKGDPDDRSHRGHPLCEFCDQRYMDNDELFRHLRRDHLFCHFCDADGFHQYYR